MEEFLPLSEGREWNYQVEKNRTIVLPDRKVTQELAGTSIERITGMSTEIKYDAPVFVLKQEIQETNRTTGEEGTSTLETHVSSEPDQILMHAQSIQAAPVMESQLIHFDDPVALLKLPLPGDDEPFPSIMQLQGMTIDSRPYARGEETVETPAGTFEDCLRISTRGPISGVLQAPQPMPIQDGSIEETLWFAKGVGLVKQVQILRVRVSLGNDQQLESVETKTKTLTAYE